MIFRKRKKFDIPIHINIVLRFGGFSAAGSGPQWDRIRKKLKVKLPAVLRSRSRLEQPFLKRSRSQFFVGRSREPQPAFFNA